MKKIFFLFCLIMQLSLFDSCKSDVQIDPIEPSEIVDDYVILESGDLRIKRNSTVNVLEINALLDSQILKDEDQRLLILTDPTDQYGHGILGDSIEASSVTIVQVSDQPVIVSKFSVPADWVIESILPIWSDWDGDGEREIVLTLSNSTSGSKLVLYDESGNILAESLPIGRGFRWRHALGIESFGSDGQMLLVDVVTPHIGGIVNFYSWDKEKKLLTTEASLKGFSTHDIGSKEMQMYAFLIDDESEQVSIIVPDQSKTELVALHLEAGKIYELWRLLLDGKLSGNLQVKEENGDQIIYGIIDNDLEVLLDVPK